jgi:MFS family permease
MEPQGRSRSLGRAFQGLLVAATVTNLGDGIRLAALPLLATTLTDSPFLIASVTAAQFLPWLLFGPFGGVIVDRADRRRLILFTQAWRGFVMVCLGALVLADMASIWMVFAVAFVITVGEILVDPSVVAVLPSIVHRDDLDRANGRISSVEIVTNDLIGAPVGVGLFAAVPWLPFIVDGMSYVGSIVPFRRLPRQPRPGRGGLDLRQISSEVFEGLRWIGNHRMLRPWTMAVATFNLGASAAFSLLVVLVPETHGGSEFAFGVTLTGAAIAGAVGSATAPRLAGRYGRPPVLLGAAALGAASLLAVAGAPSLVFVVGFWAIGGGMSGVLLAIGRGYVQRYCPNEILGRAAIASRTITRTAFVVGALLGGTVAVAYGVRSAFAVAGLVQAAALVPMGLALRHDRP